MNEAKYPLVFTPIQIGPFSVRNRFYFSPHGTPLSAGASPSNDFVRYYEERALGGCGLLVHSISVLPGRGNLQSAYSESTVGSFSAVAEAVHAHDAKLIAQVHFSAVSPFQWAPLSPMRPLLGPSEYQRFDHHSVSREMSHEEIRLVLEAFKRCARNLSQAGYDGFELHCTHGMLGEQFLSGYWNRRQDEYGGDLDNRLRFVLEMIAATVEGAGSDKAIGLRFNCDEMMPGGWDQDDAREILGRLVKLGVVDFVDLDVAVEPHQFVLGMPSYLVPKHSNASFVAAVRDAARPVPVLSALGRVTSIAEAEEAIAAGTADLVGAARALIAEPELVRQAAEGREEDSRTCIACNWCMGAMHSGSYGCAINPASARERRWGLREARPAAISRRVVVVGAGPAGLESARVAAERGHDVVLFERHDELGGQYLPWASLPGRDVLLTVPAWYGRQFGKLGVDVRLGVAATADTVLAQEPDCAIVATGSRYANDGTSGFIPHPITGALQPFVFTPEQILEEGARPSGRVVVFDDEGLNTGAGIAELLAESGATVELITRWQRPVEHLFITLEFAMIIPKLKAVGVAITTETYLKEIHSDHTLTVFDVFTNAERRTETVDALVLVTMRRAVNELSRALEGRVDQLFPVGDALAPRDHGVAFFEGQKFARLIGEEDAPRTFAQEYFAEIPPDHFPAPAEAPATAAI